MYAHKKSVGTYLLPVPRLKALALPDIVERATPIAHADMDILRSDPTSCEIG